MFDDFLEQINQLRKEGEPFAMAIVVGYTAPISGKPGNKAVITRDGEIHGWIGGGCTQAVVSREGKQALKDGKPRMVKINPEANAEEQEGVNVYDMSCHSGGSIEVYIEPVLMRPQLVIIGSSAIAQSVARLGKAMNYGVIVMAKESRKKLFADVDLYQPDVTFDTVNITPHTFIIAATQGERDEEALEISLKTGAQYIAFVGSKKKIQAIKEQLADRGFKDEELSSIKSPAGLDIGAQLPEEIGLSIIAEIVALIRDKPKDLVPLPTIGKFKVAKDPICGMDVEIAGAEYKSEYKDETYYFCCSGCQYTFDNEPERYVVASR